MSKDDVRMTALMVVVYQGHASCVKLLLPVRDARSKSAKGWSASTRSAINDHTACVQLLLALGDALKKQRWHDSVDGGRKAWAGLLRDGVTPGQWLQAQRW